VRESRETCSRKQIRNRSHDDCPVAGCQISEMVTVFSDTLINNSFADPVSTAPIGLIAGGLEFG